MLLVEDAIRRQYCAQRFFCQVAHGLIYNGQLIPQLRRRALHINRAQNVLPETPPHGQQGIVIHPDPFIFLTRADFG